MKKEFDTSYWSTLYSIVFSAFVIIAIFSFLTFLLVSKFVIPLQWMAEELNKIAEGEGDLTKHLNLKGADEIA